jgi:predicted house-cleaning noncanonical NTP pyrophosphatase (MazG superfamily)
MKNLLNISMRIINKMKKPKVVIHNKLIRDKVLEIIEKAGNKAIYHIADHNEFRQKLFEKLQEEVNEFMENPSSKELADIDEVLDYIKKVEEFSDFEKTKEKRAKENGKFEKKIILEKAINYNKYDW